MKALFAALICAVLSGCVVYPIDGYYATGNVTVGVGYEPDVYIGPYYVGYFQPGYGYWTGYGWDVNFYYFGHPGYCHYYRGAPYGYYNNYQGGRYYRGNTQHNEYHGNAQHMNMHGDNHTYNTRGVQQRVVRNDTRAPQQRYHNKTH